MSKICQNCQKTFEDDTKFCDSCGAELTAAEAATEEVTAEEAAVEAVEPSEESVLESITSAEEVAQEEVPAEAIETAETAEQEVVEEPAKNKTRKVTAWGVVGAILLSIFLLVNLVLLVGSGAAMGLFAADADTLQSEIRIDGNSVNDLVKSVASMGESETNALTTLVESGSVEFESDGKMYKFDIPEESRTTMVNAVSKINNLNGTVDALVKSGSTAMLIAMAAFTGYIALVTLVLIIAICWCLGKSRKAIMLPGIMLIVIGLATLGFALAITFASGTFGAAGALIVGIKSMLLSTLCTAAGMAVIGMILTIIGITGKSKKA